MLMFKDFWVKKKATSLRGGVAAEGIGPCGPDVVASKVFLGPSGPAVAVLAVVPPVAAERGDAQEDDACREHARADVEAAGVVAVVENGQDEPDHTQRETQGHSQTAARFARLVRWLCHCRTSVDDVERGYIL